MGRQTMKKGMNKYLREIKSLIPLNIKEKSEFINILRNQIIESQIEDYNDLIEHFGKPTEVVASFLTSIDLEILIKKLNIKRIMKTCIITFMIFGAIVTAFKLYKAQLLYEQVRDHQPAYYEILIEED